MWHFFWYGLSLEIVPFMILWSILMENSNFRRCLLSLWTLHVVVS